MAFLAGKGGGVSVAAAVWKLSKWSADMKTDILDVTNFESGGYRENIAGLTSATINCSGPFDSTAMALTAGTSYALTLEASSGVSYAITARCESIKINVDVKDPVTVDISFSSTGSFTAAIA